MQEIIARFVSFDKLIGPVLVKLVYYVFAVAILVGMIGGVFSAVLSLIGGQLGTALMQLIAVPVVSLVGLVTWRFVCEICMLSFKTYERLGEIRDRLPDYSQF